MTPKVLHHRSSGFSVQEDFSIVSGKVVTVANRLFTAVMLVALLIACQEMPENKPRGEIELERLAD